MSGNLDLDVRTPQPIPPSTVPIADPKTGNANPAWQRFFRQVWNATGMQGGTFRGMPKISVFEVGTVAPGAFGSSTITFATPWPNFAELVVCSSSNASIVVAARDLTLVDFLLVWTNTSGTTLTGTQASWIVYGG